MLKKCTKICSFCKIEKPISEFGREKRAKDGLKCQCNTCKSEYSKNRYQNNKEKVKAINNRWIGNNKERRNEINRRYRKNNKDKRNEACREWRKINKLRVIECNKKWYDNNREYVLEYSKKYRKANKEKIMARNDKRRRNLGFNPLNEKFPGSVGHHINRNDVIYIPEEIHKSIQHKQGDEVSMSKINELAINFLCGDICGGLS